MQGFDDEDVVDEDGLAGSESDEEVCFPWPPSLHQASSPSDALAQRTTQLPASTTGPALGNTTAAILGRCARRWLVYTVAHAANASHT
jgi:hypothetical protein